MFHSPDCRCTFFNPVAHDSKISISVASLPCITRQANFTDHSGTLTRYQWEKTILRKRDKTLRWSRNEHSCCLNIVMVRALDCLGKGSRMPWLGLARDAMSSIFLSTALLRYCRNVRVMTTLKKVSDLFFFLPFPFSLYQYSEPSGTLYATPDPSAMTHTPGHFSMT